MSSFNYSIYFRVIYRNLNSSNTIFLKALNNSPFKFSSSIYLYFTKDSILVDNIFLDKLSNFSRRQCTYQLSFYLSRKVILNNNKALISIIIREIYYVNSQRIKQRDSFYQEQGFFLSKLTSMLVQLIASNKVLDVFIVTFLVEAVYYIVVYTFSTSIASIIIYFSLYYRLLVFSIYN